MGVRGCSNERGIIQQLRGMYRDCGMAADCESAGESRAEDIPRAGHGPTYNDLSRAEAVDPRCKDSAELDHCCLEQSGRAQLPGASALSNFTYLEVAASITRVATLDCPGRHGILEGGAIAFEEVGPSVRRNFWPGFDRMPGVEKR